MFDALRIFVRNTPALVALIMILVLATAAVSGALFTGKKADPGEVIRMEEADLLGDRLTTEAVKSSVADPVSPALKDTFLPPFSESRDIKGRTYWLGTDHLGRDVAARLWSGSTISLTIGFLAVGISVFLGIVLGGIAGYFGRSRVGLPVLATLLLLLSWGVMLAAGLPVPAWICFGIGAGIFVGQLLLALLGGKVKPAAFFLGSALLVLLATLYNQNIESETPEGAQFQAASKTHKQAYDLLLELREYGNRVKAFEDENPDNPKRLSKGEDLPAWIYASQLDLEIKFRKLDLQVARFEVAKHRSANDEALRLAQSQHERGIYLAEFKDAYKSRFEEASAAEKTATAQRDELFKAKNVEEGRKKSDEAAGHAARAATFNPEEMLKRADRLRVVGATRTTLMEKVLSESEKPLADRESAIDTAEAAFDKILETSAENPAGLRAAQFAIEAAERQLKVELAKFRQADNLLRIAAIESVLKGLESEKDFDKHEGALDLKRELAGREKQKTPAEEAVKAAKDTLAALEPIQKQTDAAVAARQLAPLTVQGSNDLIDRRGKMRKAYVIKFDTETRNSRTSLKVAEQLNGHYRYGFYRFTSHFLTTTALYLLLIVSGLMVMAAAQAAVSERPHPLRAVYLPTISVDDLVMRFTEIIMTIPVLFLILAILAVFEKDVYITMGVIGLTSWMGTTRFVRAEILSLREQDFVQAARSLGLSDFRIIWRHLVPNAISPVLVSATLGVAGAVLAESTLSFLGIGAKPDQTTWGQILSEGREYIFDAPWLTWIPGLAILFTVLAFNLLGEGLREAFNPKLRGR